MKQNKTSVSGCNHIVGRRMWKIIGCVALALLATGVITQLSDIRRYIKISTM